jgi:Kef-type K+ transport system membrane component KefB
LLDCGVSPENIIRWNVPGSFELIYGAKLMLDGSPVIDDNLYAAIIVMILFTTLVTPPLLKIIIDKKEAKSH